MDRAAAREALYAKVAEVSAAGGEGALLRLRATDASVREARSKREPAVDLEMVLAAAGQLASRLPRVEVVARTMWASFELVVVGQRESLIEHSIGLVRALDSGAETGHLRWQAILTRIFPREPDRTLICDPEYDVRSVTGSLVAWVDPYPGDDWRESQRYPAVSIAWPSAAA